MSIRVPSGPEAVRTTHCVRKDTVCAGDTDRDRSVRRVDRVERVPAEHVGNLGAHTANCGGAVASEVLMSEYIEGSGFNKAIEIYNGTGGAVDLAAGLYTLELYSNGSSSVASKRRR